MDFTFISGFSSPLDDTTSQHSPIYTDIHALLAATILQSNTCSSGSVVDRFVSYFCAKRILQIPGDYIRVTVPASMWTSSL